MRRLSGDDGSFIISNETDDRAFGRDALKYWAELCGKTAIDEYLHGFIRDEIQLRDESTAQKWQNTLCMLIEMMLRYGMPMERLNPRLDYQDECNNARNAEEALLVVLSSCSSSLSG